jgi:CelD/BcsL family acetyltransferase involved in cellulose biosynthesis
LTAIQRQFFSFFEGALMKVSLISGEELKGELIAKWEELRRSNPALGSPYFYVEFTQVVAAARKDTEVAVIEDNGRVAAFLPFHRMGRAGKPVGSILCDYQGLICAPDFSIDAHKLLRSCRLDAYDFDHLVCSQARLASYQLAAEPSPQMDLTQGYEAYVRERRAAGSELITNLMRKTRKIEREVGPLRFVSHSDDRACFTEVIGWKSRQYLETGVADLFEMGWFRRVVEGVHRTQTPQFGGRLSLLYAGDRLVAGHMGMQAGPVWHYWFPAYDPVYAKYSPGLILLLKLAELAAGQGVRIIDLGKGMYTYKVQLMNASAELVVGSAELPSLLRLRRFCDRELRRLIKRTGLAKPIRTVIHWGRGGRQAKRAAANGPSLAT